jgi:23S rRNA pseudouridine955/2504/2580 synthase
MKEDARFISFPEGRLSEASLRLDLIADFEGWFAVSKPPGLVLVADPWQAGRADLISALRTEITAGKKQLATLGIVAPNAINRIDVDESGVAILAKNDDAGAVLKDLLGSSGLKMTYELLAEGSSEDSVIECSLPLSRHREQQCVLVSHRSGKKASTTFRRIESFGSVSQWEAETSYSRLHQIRIHAAECGLGILGERLYRSVPLVHLSDLKKNFRRRGRPERPIYGHIALHLKRVEIVFPDQTPITVEAPPPRRYAVLIKRLREYSI